MRRQIVPNYELQAKRHLLLFAICLSIHIPQPYASESTATDSEKVKGKQVNKSALQEIALDEEFLLFLADFENQQGEPVDPLDMLSVELFDSTENSALSTESSNQTSSEQHEQPAAVENQINLNQTKENK